MQAEPSPVSARRWWTPATVHGASLVIGLAVILIAARDQWFFGDDWAILAPHLDDQAMAPHVGHWNLVPAVVFPALRSVVGLHSYLPYLGLALIAHLAVVHLSWRILRRVGVSGWLATLLAAVLLVLGGGAENILWAFQFGFVGAIALGLLVVLLLDAEKPVVPLVIALAIVAPMFSGTAIPLLVAAGVLGWVRRGLLRTALVLAPAAAVYLSWYLLLARQYPSSGQGFSGIADLIPAALFAGAMLAGGLGRALPFIGLGVLVAAAAVVWVVVTLRAGVSRRDAIVPALALATGALVFIGLTTFSRVGNGLSAAAAERYAYCTIVLVIPVVGLALSGLASRSRRAFAVMLVALALVVASNAVVLFLQASLQSDREATSRERILDFQTRLLASPNDTDLLEAMPDAEYAPDLLGADLLTLGRSGELP